MKSLVNAFVFGAVLLLAGPVLRAEITCKTEEYRGSYAFYTAGSLLHLPPQGAVLEGPFAQSGTFTMDGLGGAIIESRASYNGLLQPANVVGTYTITPDCLVKFFTTLPFPLSVPTVFTGVLSGNMREEVLMIAEPAGTVIVGRHYKQAQRFCGNADFAGPFEVDLRGTYSAAAANPGMAVINGRLVSAGDGTFTAKLLFNYAGSIVSKDIAGTYDVNAKCFVTLTYADGGQQSTIFGALAGTGNVAMMMLSDQGAAISGTFKSQQ
ncbi:MAG: hypothetical protein ABL995_00365 [Bryobacteraceae bacterium]